MSFVINKAAKKSLFEITHNSQTPGPGKYSIQQRTVIQIPAPFNSSVPKISTFESQQYNQQGPGFYNDVNMKQIYQVKMKFPTTSSFASKVQRFKTEPSLTTTNFYTSANDFSVNTKKRNESVQKAKQKMRQLRQQNHKQKTHSIEGKKQFVRVILSNPKNTQSRQGYYIDPLIQKKTSGPGQYEVAKTFIKQKGIMKWQNSKQKRFKSASTITPGVGYYQLQKSSKRKTNLSSSFAYSGLKSHLDAIIYNTNIPLKKQLIEQSGLKSLAPGPGQYQLSRHSRHSFNYAQSTFGTKARRFTLNGQGLSSMENLGPGCYEITNDYSSQKQKQRMQMQIKRLNKSTPGKHRSIQNFNRNDNLVLSSQKIEQMSNKSEQKSLSKRKSSRKTGNLYRKQKKSSTYGNWGHQIRFKTEKIDQNHTKVGPGQYETTAQPFSQQKISQSYMFTSKCERQMMKNYQSQSRPFYNICQNDIGSRMKKIKFQLDNLRKVAIERVPFASGASRFQQPIIEQAEPLLDERKAVKIHRKNEASMVFKSKSERVMFIAKSDKPGPGEYELQGNHLLKKSFNRNYNYEGTGIFKLSAFLKLRSKSLLEKLQK